MLNEKIKWLQCDIEFWELKTKETSTVRINLKRWDQKLKLHSPPFSLCIYSSVCFNFF